MKNTTYILFITITALHNYSLINASMKTKDRIGEIGVAWRAASQNHKELCHTCQQSYREALSHRLGAIWLECCEDSCTIDTSFRNQIAQLALSADDLTHVEKLGNLTADRYFEQRKAIIKNMIQEGINPKDIVYFYDMTPMKDASLRRDQEFIDFLKQHGAH